MGIPSYFSTIKRKYAKHYNKWMVNELPKQQPTCKHLYVDMNGIVHTSAQRIIRMYESHIVETYQSLSHTQLQQMVQMRSDNLFNTILQPCIFKSILSELQHLLDTVQPTELMFLALDGVAPRAKMEQQRQRRHRSVCDTAIERKIYNRHKKAHLRGMLWDSNCVTPGTPFMTALATFMHSHIEQLVAPNACKIYFSDTSEHGEGEHKIMEHMRAYASSHIPHTSTTDNETLQPPTFVLYGQDADLIMLGLAFISQYDIQFYVLRESTSFVNIKKIDEVDNSEETVEEIVVQKCYVDDSTALYKWTLPADKFKANTPLQYLNVCMLQTQIIWHIESYGDIYTQEERSHVTKDYILLCFLLGNDFLPHSPSLSIQDKGVDVLLETYVPLRKQFGVFLTSEHTVHTEDESAQGCLHQKGCTQAVTETHIHQELFTAIITRIAQQEDYLAGRLHTNTLQKRKWMLQQQRYPKTENNQRDEKKSDQPQQNTSHQTKNKLVEHTLEHELKHINTLQPAMWALDDKVLPGTPGWKRRYYTEVERVFNMNDVHVMCRKFLEGLYWTLQYYLHGCYSTMWFYPYISTPLFSNIEFTLQQPRMNVNRLFKRHTKWEHTSTTQLLTIMPKESLEKYVYNTQPNTTLTEHAISYKLISFSKRFRWECPVRLPVVDETNIQNVAKRLSGSLI